MAKLKSGLLEPGNYLMERIEMVSDTLGIPVLDLIEGLQAIAHDVARDIDHSYDDDEHKPAGTSGFHADPMEAFGSVNQWGLTDGAHPKQYRDGNWAIVNRSETHFWSIGLLTWMIEDERSARVGYFPTALEAVARFQQDQNVIAVNKKIYG